MLPSMPSLTTPIKHELGTDISENFVHPTEINLIKNVENHEKEKTNTTATCKEIKDNVDDADDTKKVKIRTPRPSLAERHRQKCIKESKLLRDILAKHPDLEDDINYAQSYYERVQERLKMEGSEDLKKFHEIVQTITNGEDPCDVYRKLELLFLPKHPDLLEQFLTFLLPAQAAKIGKLMEYFLICNMDKFMKMINAYYLEEPTQIQKICTTLSELCDVSNVSMDDVKSSILPLLKENQLLVEFFLQLFPSEKAPECDLSDFEHLDFDKMDTSNMFDHIVVPEENDDPYGGDNCICKCHDSEDEKYRTRHLHCIPCGMKYIQGRIYIQTGKRLRPATVTFDDSLPMSVHVKRLSAKSKRHKRRRRGSPSKLPLSANSNCNNEHRLDMDNEDDAKKSPKKNSKLGKNIQNRCKNKRDFVLKEDDVVEKDGDVLKSIDPSIQTKKTQMDVDNGNFSTPDPLPIVQEENVAPVCATNNSQENFCSSTEPNMNNDIESNNHVLQVFASCDELNVSLESDGKVSPVSPVSSDISACSDSDVSVHSEKSDLINSDSENSSIDDTEENSNDSDMVDDFSEKNKNVVEEQNDDLANSPERNETSDEEEMGSTSDTDESDGEDMVILNNDGINEKIKIEDDDRDSKTWTRDEDKIVLQTFQEQCDFDSTVVKICELLPHKNMMDVKNRFQVLLNLLKEISAQD